MSIAAIISQEYPHAIYVYKYMYRVQMDTSHRDYALCTLFKKFLHMNCVNF